MMKRLKRAAALFLCPTMTLSQDAINFTRTESDDPQDYSVNNVSLDASNDRVYANWLVGDSHTSYVVQLYSSSDLKPKCKIGTAITAGYTVGETGVTDKILKHGAGTYYAQATVKKKTKGQGRVTSTTGTETITAEGIMMIEQDRDNADEVKTFAVTSTVANQNTVTQSTAVQTQAVNTQNTGTQNTAATTGHWVSLENGGWSYVSNDGQKTIGWFQIGDKWYYAGSGGVMWANVWIKSAAGEDVYYYVGCNGETFVSTQTPDNYLVDYAGKWRP